MASQSRPKTVRKHSVRSLRVTLAAVTAILLGTISLFTGIGNSHAADAPRSIWSATTVPRSAPDPETRSVELGTVFRSDIAGTVSGVRYYRSAPNQGPHTGSLWSANGVRLAQVKFMNETATGWQVAAFSAPVRISKGERYTVSYRAPKGRYAADIGVFSNNKTVRSKNLTASAGVYTYGSGAPTQTWYGANYYVDVLFSPDAPSGIPSPTPTPTPAPPSAPTGVDPGPRGFQALGRSFPSEATTGVPAGTTLAPYDGPCTIQTPGTIIDAKMVNCSLRILAPNVKISRSQIKGTIYADVTLSNGSFTISDSWVNMGDYEGTGIGEGNFTATRVHVSGGSRSINCAVNCTVEQSYVHGQFRDSRGRAHESGIRIGAGSVLRGNTIGCTAPPVEPDAGCSAAITGYGDFATVEKNTIDGNLILAGHHGYCAYGGSTQGKPYSAGVNNIKFTNNIWQRGSSGHCGIWGPVTSFDSAAPGNIWSNNLYDDGAPVPPAN